MVGESVYGAQGVGEAVGTCVGAEVGCFVSTPIVY